MVREKVLTIGMALFLPTLAVCGCGEKKAPDDTPWNNGVNAIMETENGYYSNLMYTQSLRFYERGTDTEIYLCGKPECPHDGRESCTATYRNLSTVNSVLYDGAIYILVTEVKEDRVSYDLYRAAPDGSAIDKVGEVFSAEVTLEDGLYYETYTPTGEPSAFIIHRGYAYVPFYLQLRSNPFPKLLGGGIMKMDLKTGQTEQIYTMKRMDSPYPWEMAGCGDYVYFCCHKQETNDGYYRYDTRDGSLTHLKEKFEEMGEIAAFTEGRLYAEKQQERDGEIQLDVCAYDSETGEELGSVLQGLPYYYKLVPYRDKLFVYYTGKLVIYSEEGEALGELAYDLPGQPEERVYYPHEGEFFLRISDEKIYAILQYPILYDEERDCEVYCCPIRDILEGKGEWSHVYTVKSLLALTGDFYKGPLREGGQIYYELNGSWHSRIVVYSRWQ